MRKSIFLSISLHVLLVLFYTSLLTKNSDTKNKKQAAKSIEVQVIENQEKTPSEETLVLEKDKPGENKNSSKNDKCDSYYGGIGVQQDILTLKLLKVYSGYAADRAGLRAGDIIQSIAGEEIKGEIGTTLSLRVIRNSTEFTITIVREKICYEDI